MLKLGDALLADPMLAEILQQIDDHDAPFPGAIFLRHDTGNHLHCELRLYFSPATSEWARRFEACACGKPSPDGLSLVRGATDAWKTHFPGSLQARSPGASP